MPKAHPKHPKCPKCGKAMYKGLKGDKPPKKSDPWRFCRNKKCDLFAKDQTISGEPTVVGENAMEAEWKRHKRIQDAIPPIKVAPDDSVEPGAVELRDESGEAVGKITNVAPSATESAPEPEAVSQARKRIRDILDKAVPGPYDHNIISIALVLVSQETGNHRAANALISELDLSKYGIAPVKDR